MTVQSYKEFQNPGGPGRPRPYSQTEKENVLHVWRGRIKGGTLKAALPKERTELCHYQGWGVGRGDQRRERKHKGEKSEGLAAMGYHRAGKQKPLSILREKSIQVDSMRSETRTQEKKDVLGKEVRSSIPIERRPSGKKKKNFFKDSSPLNERGKASAAL